MIGVIVKIKKMSGVSAIGFTDVTMNILYTQLSSPPTLSHFFMPVFTLS